MIFSISTLPFIAQMVKKIAHFKYFYCDYFTVIRNHFIGKLMRESEQMSFTW